jgi:hypothetical protein
MPSTKLPRKRGGVGETYSIRFSRHLLVAGAALFFLSGYSVARLTERAADTQVAERSLQPDVAADETIRRPVHATRPIVRPFVMREVSSCSGHDPDEERTYRARQAAELMDLLRQQARMAEKTVGRGGPEAVANALGPYTAAWADAVVRTAPDLAEELAAEMERTLCGADTSDAQSVVVSRTMARMPELGNGRAFDCIAARGKEDAVLWAALDAWRLGTSPLTPELQALASASKDERTLRRLIKQEDELEEPPPNIPPEQQINTSVEFASPEGAAHGAGEAVNPQLLANGAREARDPGE